MKTNYLYPLALLCITSVMKVMAVDAYVVIKDSNKTLYYKDYIGEDARLGIDNVSSHHNIYDLESFDFDVDIYSDNLQLKDGYFILGTPAAEKEAYVLFSNNGKTLTFYYDDQRETREGTSYSLNEGINQPKWNRWNINTVVFDSSFAEARPETTYSWFDQAYNLKSIIGIEFLNTSNVTNMGKMFDGCRNLTSLDVTHFDTSKVTSMGWMFAECISLNTLDITNFDTSKVMDMSYMFYGCRNLTSLDVTHFDTSNVIEMQDMFDGCGSLTSLDVTHFDTSKVTDMSWMFYGCNGLTSLDVTNFDTSGVSFMCGMFQDCSSLSNIDVSNFDTSNVIDMMHLFAACSNLSSIDISNFDTSNVTDMNEMFACCESLTSIDLSNFDTSNVYDMSGMFYCCSALKSLDLSIFDTSNVENMSYMFQGCKSLVSLDISSFNTSKVINMNCMFEGCASLATLDMRHFDTSNVVDIGSMFENCSSLEILDLSGFDTSNLNYEMSEFSDELSFNNRLISGCYNLKSLSISSTMTNLGEETCLGLGTSTPCTIIAPDGFDFGVDTSGDYFQWKGGYFKLGKEEAPKEAYAILTDDPLGNGKNLLFYYDSEKSTHTETLYSLNEGENFPAWNDEQTAAEITGVAFHCDFSEALPTSGYCWFYEMSNLEHIDDMQFFDTSNMTTMAGMFFYCSKLNYIGAQGFDTSRTTNMWAMFYGCSALEELDVSGFNTSLVTDMTGMFCYCGSLATLDVSHFDTGNVTSFNGMFYGCKSLTSLDLGNFDLSSATDTQNMLAYCTGLTELTVSLSMQNLADGACAGIGTASSPCTIYAPAGFNFGVSTSGSCFQWKGGYFRLGAQTALLGDVNASGSVTLADAICEISWLLEQNPPVFVEAVADYNQDNVVSVSDAIAIIQYVVTVEPDPIRPDVPDEDVAKLIEEMSHLRSATNGFDLTLGDLRDYTAFTADITLGDDATLLSASLGTHSVATHSLGGGRYRIVAWSMDMAPIGAGAVLRCKTTGGNTSAVTLDHIRIVDMNTCEHAAPAVECTPTGIREVEADAAPVARYRIDGTRVSSPQRGIYIEDGRKVVR